VLLLQPILCEASYVLLEYARTAMFMWMFIEGLYLHNMITGEARKLFLQSMLRYGAVSSEL
jgi:hypothetical protein